MKHIPKELHELMDDYFTIVKIDDFLDSYLKIETFEGMTIDNFFPSKLELPIVIGKTKT